MACARCLLAEAAAGGGAAGTEVGAQTWGLRPVLLCAPGPPRAGEAEGRRTEAGAGGAGGGDWPGLRGLARCRDSW